MSLAERISSIEDYDAFQHGRRDSSPGGSRDRKLSFNPVQTWTGPPTKSAEPVGAFEVSKTKRIFQVAVAVIYCLLSAGIVFGYAALKPVLVREGVYRNRCSKEELRDGVEEGHTCYEQELHLNLMFTTAAVATNVCALPVGTILDKYGPRVSGVIGSILIATGCVLFAFAWQLSFDAYIPGYFFLALGGPFVFISSFQLSNTFPSHSGLILSMLTGAFDSSSAIFLFYRIVYDWSGGTFWPKKFFLSYLLVPIFILIAQLVLMPRQSYKTVGELVAEVQEDLAEENETITEAEVSDPNLLAQIREQRRIRRESVVGEITELLGPKGGERHAKREERKKDISGVWGALHGYSAMEQIKSPWFVLITLFTVVQMTRINYFVATIRPQYEYLLDNFDKAVHVNNVFDVALPLGGVLAVPFIGGVLDNTSTPFVLGLLVSTATLIGILGLLPYMWAAYANIALFVVYRPFYYTAVSDYAAKVFGFHTFGKVYGLIICLAGLFNFSQSALDALTHKVFEGDPRPVNLILTSLAVLVGSSLVGFVWHRSRRLKRNLLEVEAERARETLMPEVTRDMGEANRSRSYGTTD